MTVIAVVLIAVGGLLLFAVGVGTFLRGHVEATTRPRPGARVKERQ